MKAEEFDKIFDEGGDISEFVDPNSVLRPGSATPETIGGSMKFQIYRSAEGSYKWRLVAANGRVVAHSGQVFSSRSHCLDDVTAFKQAEAEHGSMTQAPIDRISA